MKAPKIGSIIPVKKNGSYTGRINTDRSGEVLISVETTDHEMTVFHSSNWPLHEFRAQETCFYDGYCVSGYVYALAIPVGTEISRYPGGEIRVTISPKMDIRYLGRMICRYERVGTGRVREIARYTGLIRDYLI